MPGRYVKRKSLTKAVSGARRRNTIILANLLIWLVAGGFTILYYDFYPAISLPLVAVFIALLIPRLTRQKLYCPICDTPLRKGKSYDSLMVTGDSVYCPKCEAVSDYHFQYKELYEGGD